MRWAWALLFICVNGWACSVEYNDTIYSCVVSAGTVSGGVYRKNVNAYEKIAQPRYQGREIAIEAELEYYPSAKQWGQFMVFIDTDGSGEVLLIHAKDTSPTHIQEWNLASTHGTLPCINTQFCLRHTQYDSPTSEVDEVSFSGTTDWHVAAEYYKQWAKQQSWYQSHGALSRGQRLAHVMSCSTNAYTFYDANLDGAAELFAPYRVGCFMTQYRSDAFDVDYPDYSCSALANCPAWLQNMKDDGTIGFPYLNGILWDSTHTSYNAAEMCLDSGGSPRIYSGNLRYVDPALSTWPSTLRTAFDAIQATDSSTSEGVYIDVVLAAAPQICYYSGTPDYDAWITGAKAVAAAFDDKIIMAEGGGEIYFPYIDVAYYNPPSDKITGAIGLLGYVYGDIDDLYIVGIEGNSTDGPLQIHQHQYRARNEFYHDALLLGGGINVEVRFLKDADIVNRVKYWTNFPPRTTINAR